MPLLPRTVWQKRRGQAHGTSTRDAQKCAAGSASLCKTKLLMMYVMYVTKGDLCV